MTNSGARKWWTVSALVLATLAVGFDVTILSLALPALATDLHASTAELQWFVSAYTLVFAAGMIPAGMLGDRYGRKRLMLIALVIFGLSSLAAAYAPSSGAFIAARAVLGLGAAILLPMNLALLPVLFPEEERRKAIAAVAGAALLAYPIGPILGGWLLNHFWWGSVFLINVPVVILGILAVAAWLPETRAERPRRLDLPGVLISSAGLAVLTYGVIEAGQNGWGDLAVTTSIAAGFVALAVFVAWERRTAEPLVDLALFRSAGFTAGTTLGIVINFTMFGVLFAMPQYFQGILGTDAMGSGIRLLPLVAGLIVGVSVADRLARALGAKAAAGIGFALLAGGLFAGATTGVASGTGLAAAWFAVYGLGLGLALPTAMDAALGALPKDGEGVGSAVNQSLRTVGGSFGAAILGSVLNSAYQGRLDLTGLPAGAAHAARDSVFGGLSVARALRSSSLADAVRAAFVHGLDVILVACGVLGVLGMVLAVLWLPRRAATVGQGEREPAESEHGAAV
ncbi:MAG TPA: DHA2 family efflux MFS transporter permease subunit [Streptosporangiaceae bacterium]|jgi:EmrB/QacA subfamily drug resistance transporter